jgi:hypothetical protein
VIYYLYKLTISKIFYKKEEGEIVMKESIVLNRLGEIPNGRFFKMTWKSEVPVFSKFNNMYEVTKITTSTVRKGIKYTNTKTYKTKFFRKVNENRTDYMIAPVNFNDKTELPWGHYRAGYENLIIDHTNKAGEKNSYLRLYVTPNKPKSKFYLNGKEISKEELKSKGIVKESYWTEGTNDGVFNIKIKNILSI